MGLVALYAIHPATRPEAKEETATYTLAIAPAPTEPSAPTAPAPPPVATEPSAPLAEAAPPEAAAAAPPASRPMADNLVTLPPPPALPPVATEPPAPLAEALPPEAAAAALPASRPMADNVVTLPPPATVPRASAPVPQPRPVAPPRTRPSPPHVQALQAQAGTAPGRAIPSAPAEPTPSLPPLVPAQPPAPPQSGHPSAAWLAGVSDWLNAHRIYPETARQLGQEGTVLVHFTVDREGHVLDVALVRGSGSEALDRAAVAMLRGARLPPFTPDMTLAQQGVAVPIHYRLQ